MKQPVWEQVLGIILLALIFLLCALGLHAGTPQLDFGHPAKWCDVEGHKGPQCAMGSCARYDKDGKVTGARCSKFCAKSCCGCGEECTMAETNPDEEQIDFFRVNE